jgi:hypothetical protein
MMALIDERGRLFGRMNLIDAGVALLLIVIGAGVFVGYRLLRLPQAPVVLKVEPETQQGGHSNMRMALRGENFLPFMKVFVQRTGNPTKVIKTLDSGASGLDQFVLVNYTQARFFAESPRVAEVWLPDKLGAGTYDLVFFNETQMVGVKQAAFTLSEPPPPPAPPPGAPRANIRAYGAFIAIDRANPPHLTAGMRLPTDAAEPWAEILEIDPARAETTVVRTATGDITAEVKARDQLPAVLRLHCVVEGLNCGVPGANVLINSVLPIRVGDKTITFHVQDMGPDAADVVRDALVDVRFIVKPEIAAMVKDGDADLANVPANMRVREAAVIRSRSAVEESAGTLSQNDGVQVFVVPGKLVSFAATLAMPVMQTPTGWFYRDQPVKAGAYITFGTAGYVMRGMVFKVELARPGAPMRSAAKQ